MSEYQGYFIRRNSETRRWEIYWKDEKLEVDFAREADAEEWIDDQIPLNR